LRPILVSTRKLHRPGVPRYPVRRNLRVKDAIASPESDPRVLQDRQSQTQTRFQIFQQND
jgi:hypothetical protein